jgi:hypothetical protein
MVREHGGLWAPPVVIPIRQVSPRLLGSGAALYVPKRVIVDEPFTPYRGTADGAFQDVLEKAPRRRCFRNGEHRPGWWVSLWAIELLVEPPRGSAM